MNVWIESPFDNLPQEGFRKQRYWLMAEAFAAAGHNVVYWTSDFNHGTKSKRRLASAKVGGIAAPVDGIRLALVAASTYSHNVSLARIWSHLGYAHRFRNLAHDAVKCGTLPPPNLVIAATPTLGAASVALSLAKSFGARFVVDIQDAWPQTFYRLLPRGFAFLGHLLFLPMHLTAHRLYRKADVVTGVSQRYAALSGRDDFYLAYHGIA